MAGVKRPHETHMKVLLRLLQPAPYIEPISDQQEVDAQYRYWRIRIFYSMFFGYAFYYFTRKSFVFATPMMVAELGFTKSELGIIASILSLAYGVSKFTSGVFSDRSNPRYFMAFGLIATGVLNIAFGLTSTLWVMAVLWGLNGWFQGCGWPPCARYLTHWYSKSERGRWWAAWNTSHNMGGAIIPLLALWVAGQFGWRWALYIPGVICILVGFWLMNRLRDTPQSLGLPSIERHSGDYTDESELSEENEKELSARTILTEYVLRNKVLWLLAIANFFVYVVRTGVNDWTHLFLVESRGYAPYAAGKVVFWFEIGGLFGSLAAGWGSDKLFRGKRGPINVFFALGMVAAVWAFYLIPGEVPWLHRLTMFSVGFVIFGPQMLVGMVAAELSHKKAAATTSGFTGLFGYLGAAAAGYPLGHIAQAYGWGGFFVALMVCGVLSTLLLIPTWIAEMRGIRRRREMEQQMLQDEQEAAYA